MQLYDLYTHLSHHHSLNNMHTRVSPGTCTDAVSGITSTVKVAPSTQEDVNLLFANAMLFHTRNLSTSYEHTRF